MQLQAACKAGKHWQLGMSLQMMQENHWNHWAPGEKNKKMGLKERLFSNVASV